MRKIKNIFAFVLTLILLCAVSLTAYAKDVPDTSRRCSFSVIMTYNNKTVSGGNIILYKVGDINENDGNYSFVLSREFKDSNVSLSDISSPAAAIKLSEFANLRNIRGQSTNINRQGKAQIGNLEPGLYLASQTRASDGYKKIEPFLVSLPEYEDGKYNYNVDASPKISLSLETTTKPGESTTHPEKENTTSPSSQETTGPSGTPGTKKKKATLPYTGQLNWPIPLMTALGIILFTVGTALYTGKKDREV